MTADITRSPGLIHLQFTVNEIATLKLIQQWIGQHVHQRNTVSRCRSKLTVTYTLNDFVDIDDLRTELSIFLLTNTDN